MADVNSWNGTGRLTRDMEVKMTSGGQAVGKFSIAVNRSVKRGDQWEDEASFLDVTLWGKRAEALAQYLVKGQQVAVSGSLVQNRWEKDGKTMSKVEINADNIVLCGKRSDSGQSAPVHSSARSAPDDVPPDFPDDIPFN